MILHITQLYLIYFRIPYIDGKTPLGYFLTSLFSIALLYYLTEIIFCALFLHFGFCVLSMALMVDFKQSFNSIEEKIKLDISNKKGKLSMTAVVDIEKDVREMVMFHGDGKQLS